MFGWIRRVFRRRAPAASRGLREHRRTRAPIAAIAGTVAIPRVEASAADALVSMLQGPLTESADTAAVDQLEAQIRDGLKDATLKIPPFPSAAARVLAMVERRDLDLNELVRVLHWEPAVVSEVIAAAHTAAYAMREPVDDLRSVVIALGVRQVGSIAAGVSARSLFEIDSKAAYELFPELWVSAYRETLVVAFAASWLAQSRRVPRHDRVFLRAVIAGIGRTVALRALAARLLSGAIAERPSNAEIQEAVDRVGPDAADVAVARWSLPPTLTQVIDPANELERDVVALVATLIQLQRTPRQAIAARARGLAATLQIDAQWMRVLIRECQETQQRISSTMALPRQRGAKPTSW
jgi:HD-like signal output (HDOD) protein